MSFRPRSGSPRMNVRETQGPRTWPVRGRARSCAVAWKPAVRQACLPRAPLRRHAKVRRPRRPQAWSVDDNSTLISPRRGRSVNSYARCECKASRSMASLSVPGRVAYMVMGRVIRAGALWLGNMSVVNELPSEGQTGASESRSAPEELCSSEQARLYSRYAASYL